MQSSTIPRMTLADTERCVGPAPFRHVRRAHRRQAQRPEPACGEPVEPVEGLAAGPQFIGKTVRRSSVAKPMEDRLSGDPTAGIRRFRRIILLEALKPWKGAERRSRCPEPAQWCQNPLRRPPPLSGASSAQSAAALAAAPAVVGGRSFGRL